MKNYLEFITEKRDNGIIVYHRSDNLKHMLDCDFKLEYSADNNLFGRAIYFSTSPNINHEYFGKYICKFSIIPDEPILNMNIKISKEHANNLLNEYNTMFKTNIEFDFEFDIISYGDFFDNVGVDWKTKYFQTFIQKHLGFNSFKYYQNFDTDFVSKRTVYGSCYGIYNPKNIKFIDGPL